MMRVGMARRIKSEEPENLAEQLEELDKKLSRLRVIYEQYFIGVEKRPPTVLHHEVNRHVRALTQVKMRKTMHKFRFTALLQRFNVHRAYWSRTCREIEEGTYKKHRNRAANREFARSGERLDNAELAKRAMLLKMYGPDAVEARRERQQAEGISATKEVQAYVPAVARKRLRGKKAAELRGAPLAQVEGVNAGEAAPAAGAEAPPPPTHESSGTPRYQPPSPAASAGAQSGGAWSQLDSKSQQAAGVLNGAGISESRARAIYDTLVTARRQQGESTDKLSFEKIVKSMAKQVPKVRDAHGASAVDFDVVKKGTKVYLKPVPK